MAVALAARREDLLHRVAADIHTAGGRALTVKTDVSVDADARRFITRALTAFGGLDVVVCNAGIGYYGTLDDTPPEIAGRLLDVNVLGTFYAARAALPRRAFSLRSRPGSGTRSASRSTSPWRTNGGTSSRRGEPGG